MVGLRGSCWVACGMLLALACGRTADSDHDGSGGSTAQVGGTSSGGFATGGSTPIPEAGAPGMVGAAGEASDCPVTPIAGRWVALGPDPFGFELMNDGAQVTGQGCLGGLGEPGEPPPFGCTPLKVLADHGRSFDFWWDAGPAVGLAYVVKMQLTLSPERNAMAGKLWSTYAGVDGEGLDIVLVPYPNEPTLPATECSGGDPSGACFLAPLRTDRLTEPHIVELASGDLLMLWWNQRGIGKHIAATRFDAASGTWQPAEFFDDGSAPVDSLLLSTSTQGWAVAVFTQAEELLARIYSPKTKAWSKQQVVARAKAADLLHPSGLFVYDGGDATVIASTQPVDEVGSIAAYDYSAASNAWASPHVIEAGPENAYQWAADSDAARRQLVTWVRGGDVSKPHELWFTSRDAAGAWSAPAMFSSSDKQILRPALAIGPNGNAVVTWQEWGVGINSNSYSFETATWGATAMVTTETQRDNRVVRFDDAGAAVSYFHDYNPATGVGELKSVLTDGVWSTPQPCTEMELAGEDYTLVAGMGDINVVRYPQRKIERPLPPLERPRCEGY